jgi:hypothetical protein
MLEIWSRVAAARPGREASWPRRYLSMDSMLASELSVHAGRKDLSDARQPWSRIFSAGRVVSTLRKDEAET